MAPRETTKPAGVRFFEKVQEVVPIGAGGEDELLVVAALREVEPTRRGECEVGGASIVAELGQLSRFATAPQLMAYSGIVTRKNSSGDRIQRGPITKTGNAHLRRIIVEAAWAYRHRPAVNAAKAQHRLHQRFTKLTAKGKHAGKVVVRTGHIGNRTDRADG